jgi:hypothetical protein
MWLIGCTEEEKNEIYKFLNDFEFMKAIIIKRAKLHITDT